MNYTINIDQKSISESGLDIDIKDAVIIDFIKTMPLSEKIEKKLIGNDLYFWVSYKYVIDENPLLGIKSKDSLYRRILRLVELGLLKSHPENQKSNKSFYCFTSKFMEIFIGKDGDDLRIKSRRLKPTYGSKVGGPTDQKSEVPTDEKSDNSNTIYSYTNDTIIFDFFPEKKSDSEKEFNAILRNEFLQLYLEKFGEEFYFEGKDAGQLRSLGMKIFSKIKSKKGVVTLRDFKDGVTIFLETSFLIRSDFFLKDYNLLNLNFKFNDIFARIKERNNGTKKQSTASANQQDAISYFEQLLQDTGSNSFSNIQ